MAIVDLTTVARLKAYAELAGTRTDVDSLLAAIISSVSSTIENNLNRSVAIEAKTERRICPRMGQFILANGPATSITSVKYSQDGFFASGASTIASDNYELAPDGDSVFIRNVAGSPGYIEVQYTGGLVEDAADCLARFPDLENAALMQAAYLWKRRLTQGRSSTTLGNGETQWVGDYDLLDGVVAILIKYRRPWSCM